MKNYIHPHHIIFTPEQPRFPSKFGQNPSVEDVTKFLRAQGEKAEIIDGMYGSPERSILINSPKNVNGVFQMAKDFGQESLIHSKDGKHEMHFMNGPDMGKVVHGQGTKYHVDKPQDNFSTIHTDDGPLHFQHNFDFDKSEALNKAPLPFPTPSLDDQNRTFSDYEEKPNYHKVKEVQLPNGLLYRQYRKHAAGSGDRHHALYDNTGKFPIAILHTQHVEDPMAEGGFHPHSVLWSQVNPDYRGKGLGRQMYLATLLHGTKKLTSDSRLTAEANKAWKSFKGLPGLGGKIAQYPKPNENWSRPDLADAFENDRHQLFIRDPKQVDQNAMFPKVDLHDEEKLASSETTKEGIALGAVKKLLETRDEPETLNIPEHLQIQWSVPAHRWIK